MLKMVETMTVYQIVVWVGHSEWMATLISVQCSKKRTTVEVMGLYYA